ncbi:MAG: alpha/beta hydrolase, partial [Chloroflexi bacterium]|nr:alpha/beta hydrolase [Chloroflexota bacterium]
GSVLDSLVQIQIGEFYTYLNDRLQAANMRRQVAASINWLVKNQHCESVSVIAHSGGCDIAFGALTDLALKQAGALLEPEVLKRVNKLITFGSSLNHSWLLAPTVQVGCLPEHIHWLDIWSAYDSVPGKWPNPPSGVTVFKPSEHLVRAQGLLARPAADPSTANGDPTPARVSEDGAGVEWVRVTRKGQKLPDGSRANNDTYTWVPVTYDPRGRYWPVSEEVTNRMIVLIDHGLYWSNSEQVLVRFASEIDADFYQRSRFWRGDAGYVANSAMRIQGRTANLQQAVRDRRTRVSLLAAGRLLFGLLALAVAVVIAMLGFTSPDGEIGKFVLDYLFGTILNVLTGPVGNFFNWLASIVPPWLAGVVGFLRAAPVYVAGSIIVDLPAFTCGRSSATDSTVRTRTGAASPSTRSQPRRPDRPLVRSSVMPNTHFG